MDIKDTKDFEEKLDRDWDDNPTKYVRPYIPEMVIQDRTKIIESVIEMVEGMKKIEGITSETETENEFQDRNNKCVGYNRALKDLQEALSKLK